VSPVAAARQQRMPLTRVQTLRRPQKGRLGESRDARVWTQVPTASPVLPREQGHGRD